MKKQILKIKKETHGITLIALIITIIVLLILAGISIATLTGENGILTKAKDATEKTTEAEVKEKIGLLLAEYQLEKVEQPNLNILEYFEQKKEKGEVDSVKDNQDGTIKVGLDGYIVTINTNPLAIIDIQLRNDIEFSYQLVSYENNKFKIIITITEETNGLRSIKYPDGTIQNCNGEKLIEINYEVEEGIDYIFIATNSNGIEKNEVINLIKPAKPASPELNLNYPTLTLTGVISSKVEINFDSREEFLNYYSLDNGKTWNLYTEPIETNTSVIKAKSVHKKCQDIFEEADITVNIPVDTITKNSFDCNLETSDRFAYYNSGVPAGKYCSFYVDESTWGQFLAFTYIFDSIGYTSQMIINFYDSQGEITHTKSLYGESPSKYHTESIEIPNGTYKIQLYSPYAYSTLYLYEVGINYPNIPRIQTQYDETKVNKTILEYPILTSNGVVNCSINPEIGTKIKLEITNENKDEIENYYSLDGGNTWNLYTNPVETTYNGEGLIQAKSRNKYYKNESEINILRNYIKDLNVICTASNAIGKEAYDGNEETSSRGLMSIDSSAIDRRIKFKYKSNGTRTVNFFNSGNGLIWHTPNGEHGIFSSHTLIPNQATLLNIGSWDNGDLFEIDIDNSPWTVD